MKYYITLLLVIAILRAQDSNRLLAQTVFSEQDLMILMERSQIRGDYKDVINETSGALIVNARLLTFVGTQFTNSPLRNSCYYVLWSSYGYVTIPASSNMQIDLLQNYEINTINFWLADVSGAPATYDLQIVIANTESTPALNLVVYTQTSIPKGFYSVTFDDVQVESIIFKATGAAVSLIKVQAFYAF